MCRCSPCFIVVILLFVQLFSPGLRDALALLGIYAIWKHLQAKLRPRPPASTPGTESEYSAEECEEWWQGFWPEE